MSKQTELIYVGNCKYLIEQFNSSVKVLIKKEDIKVKKETLQESGYYPVSFECKDNIDGPIGEFIVGDFYRSFGYMKNISVPKRSRLE